jgi:hypothetical protein
MSLLSEPRKELPVRKLPFKLQVAIDTNKDGETEITNKRSLLRLNSTRVYNQMGCAARLHEYQRLACYWIDQLIRETPEDEQPVLLELDAQMKRALAALREIKQKKIDLAVEMEQIQEKAFRDSRTARMNIAKRHRDLRRGVVAETPVPSQEEPKDPSGFHPAPVLDAAQLFEQVRQNINAKELIKKYEREPKDE